MFIVISPSKSQDFERFEKNGGKIVLDNFSISEFLSETTKLSKILKKYKKKDLEKIMKISPKLAELNFKRFQNWNNDFEFRISDEITSPSKYISPVIFAFTGDVYGGFDLENWKKTDFNFAQKHLGVLSGFYGLISPLDLIKPYRLEMGVKISFEIEGEKYNNLYEFWQEKLTKKISKILKKEKVLVNLASQEYFKGLNKKELEKDFRIIYIEFKIQKKKELKVIAIYAKKARGEMANWIIKNKIEELGDLKKFSVSDWKFSKKESIKNKLVFIKKIL